MQIRLFSPPHLLALAIIALSVIFVPMGLNALEPVYQETLSIELAFKLVLIELLKFPFFHFVSRKTWQDSLPLHMCNISSMLVAWVLCFGTQWVFEIVFYWGLIGGTMALIHPDVQNRFVSWQTLTYFLSHGLMVTGLSVLFFVFEMRPHLPYLLPVFVFTVAAGLGMILLNRCLGGGVNYWYVNQHPPVWTPLALVPARYYQLAMIGLAFVLMLVAYLPFYLHDAFGWLDQTIFETIEEAQDQATQWLRTYTTTEQIWLWVVLHLL